MRILLVDDDLDQITLLGDLVVGWGHQVRTAHDGAEALKLLPSFRPNVIVTDLKMPRMDGFQMMAQLKAEGTMPPTIVLTGFGSIELAVETVHDYGGFWFLEKPVNTASLQALLQRAGDLGRLAAENERLRLELTNRGILGDLVGQSPAMLEVFGLIRQVAPTTAPVLITGESGSGKELVARAIHSCSPRKDEAFLAINCAALPATLIESELFGHERGAFTGAVERRAGALELAQGGTLFLDEIGEMPVQMQAKLLRVLEDFKFRRLGGKTEMLADVRLISATNRAPEAAIKEGLLREDLYYRLNVFNIHLPPLRDRVDDVPLIAANLIQGLNRKHGSRVTHLDQDASDALKTHQWNGNVRELRNVIERAVILAGEGPLLARHLYLPRTHGKTRQQDTEPRPMDGGLGIQVGMSIEEAERVLIEATLAQTNNNKTRAAATLGISAKTLHAKLKQYRLQGADDEPGDQSEGASA
jgi:DNA-binding NtrC family response regulator